MPELADTKWIGCKQWFHADTCIQST